MLLGRLTRRKKLEGENVWTFEMELQSTLDKHNANSGEDGEVANRRSTKAATKAEMGEMKAETKMIPRLLETMREAQNK